MERLNPVLPTEIIRLNGPLTVFCRIQPCRLADLFFNHPKISLTFSGGLPSTTWSPETTMGLSISFG